MRSVEEQIVALAQARLSAVERVPAMHAGGPDRGRWRLIAAVVLVLIVGAVFVATRLVDGADQTVATVDDDRVAATTSTVEAPREPSTTSSPEPVTPTPRRVDTLLAGLTVEIPATWGADPHRVTDVIGPDGFAKFNTLGTELTIDELAEISASHHLRPYGTEPRIESRTVAGVRVLVIYPSDDGMELEGFLIAEAIVETSPPASVVADVAHIDAVVDSIEWSPGNR